MCHCFYLHGQTGGRDSEGTTALMHSPSTKLDCELPTRLVPCECAICVIMMPCGLLLASMSNWIGFSSWPLTAVCALVLWQHSLVILGFELNWAQRSDMSGGKKGSVLWGSLSWNWRVSFLLSCTKLLLFSQFLVRPSSQIFMGWFGMQVNLSPCIRILASLLWLRAWTPVTLSISVMGVDCITPVFRGNAWFWTLSRACWMVFAVVDHALSYTGNWVWLFPGKLFSVFSCLLPRCTNKFAKNGQPASGFCFGLGSVWLPGLPLVKCDTKICCFFILLQQGFT